ncbi:MAG: V-type ATP synthase subunit E [Phycisphaerae bacterium]|nr:V-type ATP synthase subunit E [Phycisphaerae bacterium]MDD5380810.1 V-type ATP synthase subunit E [Phycisphaerae bacterium]
MDGDQVIEKILSDAKTEADKIKKDAEAKLSQQKAETDKRLDEYRKQTDALAQKAGEDARQRVLSAARMELAKENLADKAKLLDEVFTVAQQQLKKLADDKYQKLMANLMAGAVETGDEEVVIDNSEKRIDQSLVDKVNSQKKSSLKLAEHKENIGGGFILKRGKIKNNLSIGVLLGQAREQMEIELAEELFAE